MRIKINFASREYLLIRKIGLGLAVALAALLVVFVYNYRSYVNDTKRADELSGKLAEMKKTQGELNASLAAAKSSADPAKLKAFALEADFANSVIATRSFEWTAFLNRLEELVPQGVGISSITPNFQSLTVTISGNAETVADAMVFVDNLVSSQYFDDVPPVFNTSEAVVDKYTNKTIQNFSLSIKYIPEGRKASGQTAATPVPKVKK